MTHRLRSVVPGRRLALAGLVAAAVVASAPHAQATEPPEPEHGLVTALDRIGGNLLGASAFDAVLQEPPEPDEPARLRLYLSAVQVRPVEIVITTAPGEQEPPEPIRAFFRMTVGGREGLKLERDPDAHAIDPCWLAPDLRGVGAAPKDSGNGAARFRPGLVIALGEVGENLLGAGAFNAVLQEPPEPDHPAPLRLFLSARQARLVEIVITPPPVGIEPPDPDRVFFRLTVGEPELELELDPEAGGLRTQPEIADMDLGGIEPPEPDRAR